MPADCRAGGAALAWIYGQIDYPSIAEKIALLWAVTGGRVGDRLNISPVRAVADPAAVLHLQRLTARLRLDDVVLGCGGCGWSR